MLLPFAKMKFTSLPTVSLRPLNNEIELACFAATLQVPGIFTELSANGPITATVPDFFRGRTCLSFFIKTIEFAEIVLAASKCFGLKTSF